MNYKIALSRKMEPKQIFSYRRVKCNEGENSFMKWKRYDKFYNCTFKAYFWYENFYNIRT